MLQQDYEARRQHVYALQFFFMYFFCTFVFSMSCPYIRHNILAFSNFQCPTGSPFGSRGLPPPPFETCARMSGAFSEETGETTSTGLPSTEFTESEVETKFPETDDEAMYIYEPRDQQIVKMFDYNKDQGIVRILRDYHYGISARTGWGDAPSNGGDVPSNHGDVPRNCGDVQHGHNCRRGMLMFWSGVECFF